MENSCGCTGIRYCSVCRTSERVAKLNLASFPYEAYRSYVLCAQCCLSTAHRVPSTLYSTEELFRLSDAACQADDIQVDRICVVKNFMTEQEESDIAMAIEKFEWSVSQAGRRKQDFGPRANFKRRKVKPAKHDMPAYAGMLFERLSTLEFLTDFLPVEMTNLEYDPSRGSWIDFHLDDSWIWGERIVSCNLLSDAVLTFLDEGNMEIVYAPLPRRSLCCFSGKMRHMVKHGIFAHHVIGRRIAITIREPSSSWSANQ